MDEAITDFSKRQCVCYNIVVHQIFVLIVFRHLGCTPVFYEVCKSAWVSRELPPLYFLSIFSNYKHPLSPLAIKPRVWSAWGWISNLWNGFLGPEDRPGPFSLLQQRFLLAHITDTITSVWYNFQKMRHFPLCQQILVKCTYFSERNRQRIFCHCSHCFVLIV